jgi:CxxC motif-containing protein (DUF1111 family)
MKRLLASFLLTLLATSPGYTLDESIGRALFRRAWVPAPSSTKANAGLGPLFNARSCAACHQALERAPVRTDDRGIVQGDHLVLRFSDATGRPDPIYGRQFQTSSVAGVEPEGQVLLRQGRVEADHLSYGPFAAGTRTGALLAPALRGLGDLETIPDSALAEQADKNAQRQDGVSGRVNWVTNSRGERRAGRFGWKSSAATLDEQVATAFLLDLGLSTPGRPLAAGDCTSVQTMCLQAPHGGREGFPDEIPTEIVSRVSAYLRTIPQQQPETVSSQGMKLFTATGCVACHQPSLPGPKGSVHAFTDLLLHDMGPELDGGATEPGVASTEWRTAPLWGLSRTLANGSGLLHDGRAPTIPDAIRFHGGEAARSRSRFEALTHAEQQTLIAFLKLL